MEVSKRKIGSPGIAVGNEIKIMDRKGIEVEQGVQGEIMIRGDNVMKYYYKNPEKTAEAFNPDGWLHSGDIGYIDSNGFLFVTGRIKEIIIKRGENIAPKEIDDVLYKHPEVMDAAAVGIPDEAFGEDILACVVLKAGCRVTEEELSIYCKEHLGEFKSPRVIKIMSDLPKGPSGKIQRLKLRDVYNRETNRGVHQG
jgi:long-chain acyl-CoA synthetase